MSIDVFGIFGAGLLTFATPCILPMIPIYLSALIGADIRKIDSAARGQLIFRALLFSAGFILVFTLLGLAVSSVGAFLIANKTVIQAIGALIILLFGLKFVGLINITWLDRLIRADDRKLQTRFGGINAFFMGIVFAAGWSPCAGPVLGSVLTYTASATSDPLTGAFYLSVYGFGFALPLLLVAAFAEAGSRLLKRMGPSLGKVERVIGILMIIVAGSLAADVISQQSVSAPDSVGTTEKNVDAGVLAKPTMLVLTSSECSICRQMEPIVKGITSLCDGQGVIIKEYDLAQPANRPLITKYKLVATPTFVFLDAKRNEVARLVGQQTDNTLKQALSALRGVPCPGLKLLQKDQAGEDASGDISCQMTTFVSRTQKSTVSGVETVGSCQTEKRTP
ncbi:MAG: thiol:disulfide interchange protein DsbD [Deltaproteobacteria bacterium]|nr:thiol:disulfide interchange protein DsbD [Deltaproteobacteria bacterium]